MKHRPDPLSETRLKHLAQALLAMNSVDEMLALLKDLTTPAELEALSDRWCVVELLKQGLPYREIHDRTGVSVTTIGRVARFLELGHGGYRLALERTGPRDQGGGPTEASGS